MKKLAVFLPAFCTVLFILWLQNTFALSYAPLDPPSGQHTYTFAPVVSPQWAATAEDYKPIGLGPVSNGGASLNFEVGVPAFAWPVDVYLLLQSDAILNGDIILFKADNTPVRLDDLSGDPRWRASTYGDNYGMILKEIPTSALPPGLYYFFVIVTPAGDFDSYSVWVTSMTVAEQMAPVPVQGNNHPNSKTSLEQDIRSKVDMFLDSGLLNLLAGEKGVTSLLIGNFVNMKEAGMVTQTPEQLNLSELDKGIQWDFNMQNGFTASDGSVLRGSGRVSLSNIIFNKTNFGSDFSGTFNNVTRNGVLLADGVVDGNLLITGSDTDNRLSGVIDFHDLQTSSGHIRGKIDISGKNIELDIFSFSVTDYDSVTLSTSDFILGDYTINSGTITLSSLSAGSTGVDMDLSTSKGPVKMNLVITKKNDNRYIINSNGSGTLGDYSVSVENLVLDGSVCTKNPVGGQMRFSGDGVNSVVTFHSACDGQYGYSER